MFFDFFAKHIGVPPTKFGNWLIQKGWDARFSILQQAGVANGRCLEVGPGQGVLAEWLREKGVAYQGVERSPTLHADLRRRGFDVVIGAVPPLPYEDSQFDLVCAISVVEHMPSYEHAMQLIAECGRVLKPNGAIALEVPDYVRGGIDFFVFDYTHGFVTTPVRMAQILTDNGFAVDRIVHTTGFLLNPIVRWPFDLVALLVHSRFAHWFFSSIGLTSVMIRFHKTFEPGIVVVARKLEAFT